MAKKRLRIKDRSGNVVDYDVAASSVTLNDGVDVEQKIADIDEEVADLSETRYRKPVNGVPRTDLDDDVNSSLDKADSAIQGLIVNNEEVVPDSTTKKVRINIPTQVQSDWNESSQSSPAFIKNKPTVVSNVFYEPSTGKIWVSTGSRVTELIDINTFFNSISYNSSNNIISFLNKRGVVVATLDASSFVVDKFVENVTLDSSTNELVITFNTASGKSPIRVPLGSISGQGTVQSVKMNGDTPIQPVNGVVDLGTVITEHQSLSSYATKSYVEQAVQQSAGQDGKSAYQVAVDNGFRGSEAEWLASLHGADGVASADDVYVVNNYNGVPADLPQGKVAVLGAGLGTSIGKVFNVNTADANNATPYRLWVGTQAQLEVLEANDGIEDDVIYLIGTVPTPAVRYNVSKNLTNCTVPASTPATAKEGAAFSVTVSPASGYTIDSCYATMGSSTINGVPLTGANAGKYQITINAVTANISISASASVHLQSITVTQGTRAGNTIQMNAALNPANADNVSLQWSVSGGSQYVTINPSTGLLTILEGASNVSVTVTCTDTNSASGAPSGTLQLTGLSYDDSVPLVSLGAVSYTAGATANTYQFSVTKNPAGANTHSIKWDIDSVSPRGAATIDADTGLLIITNDCEVVVSAKAYQGMAQDTNINTATSGSVQLIYALTGPIQFKDLNAKRMMLYDIDNGNWVSSDKTDEDVAADTTLTYENAATKSRRPGISNANYFASGKSWPVKYFPELELFTDFNNAGDITKINSLREVTSLKFNSTSFLTGMPYLTRVSFDDSLNNLVFSGNDANQGVFNCATLQVLDFRNTQVVGRESNNGRLFHGCTKLKCVKFPATVTALGTSSNYILFGKNITSLKYLSFDGNGMTAMNLNLSNNTDVSVIFTYIPGENEELLPNLTLIKLVDNFTSQTSRLKNIYVPDDAINTYKAHSYLSTLESKIKGISELPADWDKTIFDIAMTGVHDTAASPVTQVEGWTGFSTTIQADEGNSLDNAVVTMCGEDITADVLDKTTGALNIPSVEGEVTINIPTTTTE